MINRVLCREQSDLLDSMVTWPDNKPSDWHYLAVIQPSGRGRRKLDEADERP